VKLEFVAWDCYVDPDASGIDVITYDALFTSYLAENGYIQPIAYSDLKKQDGILPYAVDGAVYKDQLYGVPFLMCSFFLIHKADNAAMAEVDNVYELQEVVSQLKAADSKDGLLTNFGTDYPYFYLDALMDISGEYTRYDEAPDTAIPDEKTVESLQKVCSSLAYTVEGYADYASYAKSVMFNDGYGSAYFGYSESMAFMDDIEDEIDIRSISFSEGENIQLYFADIASISTQVTDPEKLEDCKKLINLIGSEDFQKKLCFDSKEVQYLLPARENLYAKAEKKYPLYSRLHDLVTDEQNQIFRFGPEVYDYLNAAYDNLAICFEDEAFS
jgi:thiamine pyridinylase